MKVVDVLPDLGTSDELPRTNHEVFEERVLARRDSDDISCTADNPPRGVHLGIIDSHQWIPRIVATTNERTNASQELCKFERLDEVVVGPEIEPTHTVLDRIVCREQKYSDVR